MSKVKRHHGRDPVITLAEVEQLKAQGLTQSEIAEAYGVTRQYISWIVHHYGGALSARAIALEHFPWKVPTELNQNTIYRNLRNYAEWFATDGKGMDDEKIQRTGNFMARLKDMNLVVEFDPDIPPTPGIRSGGFAYRTRRKADKDLMIRRNKHTTITPEGKIMWRMPSEKDIERMLNANYRGTNCA